MILELRYFVEGMDLFRIDVKFLNRLNSSYYMQRHVRPVFLTIDLRKFILDGIHSGSHPG